MKNVKSRKANLENKRVIYFELGMILALSIVLLAFEWKTLEVGGIDLNLNRGPTMEEDMAEITIQQEKPPAKPEPVVAQIFEVVDNDEEITEILEISAEDDDSNKNNLEYVIEEDDEREVEEVTPFRIVQKMPSFPGGDEAYFRYMKENTSYPTWAREAGIEGVVYVEFVVDTHGEVSNAKVIRKIGGGCDEEALRVVKNMPVWNPGLQLNKPVPVIMSLPVHFKLVK